MLSHIPGKSKSLEAFARCKPKQDFGYKVELSFGLRAIATVQMWKFWAFTIVFESLASGLRLTGVGLWLYGSGWVQPLCREPKL